MSRLVLGINSAHGDASAALVDERGLVAAIAEERINRRKHCGGFPRLAVQEVLRLAGATASDLTDIAVARDPRANLAAKIAHVARHPAVNAPRAWRRLRVHRDVASSTDLVAEATGARAGALKARFHQVEHHLAHIASAFYTSPFERATGFSADGAGDFATSMTAACAGTRIDVRGRVLWPHSHRRLLHGRLPVHRLRPLRRGVQGDGPLGLRREQLRPRDARARPRRPEPRRRRPHPRSPVLPPPPHRRGHDRARRRRGGASPRSGPIR